MITPGCIQQEQHRKIVWNSAGLQSPYSSVLSSTDYYIFQWMKTFCRRKLSLIESRFKTSSKKTFSHKKNPAEFYRKGTEELLDKWNQVTKMVNIKLNKIKLYLIKSFFKKWVNRTWTLWLKLITCLRSIPCFVNIFEVPAIITKWTLLIGIANAKLIINSSNRHSKDLVILKESEKYRY